MPEIDIQGYSVVIGTVLPEWIDVNGHMNVAYYVLAFDKAVDSLWAELGITDEYIERTGGSTFAVEGHVTWQRELCEAEPYRVTSQILAYDEKRIHQFQRMYHAEKGFLAATAEWLNLHVDLKTRRVSPWPDFVIESLATFTETQQGLGYPAEAGRRMTVRKPIWHADRDYDNA
jgi:acyl-CoA thioester hydrolase